MVHVDLIAPGFVCNVLCFVLVCQPENLQVRMNAYLKGSFGMGVCSKAPESKGMWQALWESCLPERLFLCTLWQHWFGKWSTGGGSVRFNMPA